MSDITYETSIGGILRQSYGGMCKRNVTRGHGKIKFRVEDFLLWAISKTSFSIIYNAWVESGFKRSLKPSVDRIDNTKGYILKNMTMVTWETNDRNGVDARKEEIHQFTKDGVLVYTYPSITDATSSTGIKIHLNLEILEGGYIWIRDDVYSNEYLKYRIEKHTKQNEVLQYDLKGKYIGIYPNVNTVLASMGGKENSLTTVLTHKTGYFKGFLWFRKKTFLNNDLVNVLRNRYGTAVIENSKRTIIFKNIKTCADITKITIDDIKKICDQKNGRFIWYYKYLIKKQGINNGNK